MPFGKPNKYIHFHNNTSKRIILESWIEVLDGLSSFTSKSVNPGMKLVLYSSVGEWTISDDTFCYIGKFRSEPGASGNYSWLSENDYECIYSETNENDIIGLITFSKKG